MSNHILFLLVLSLISFSCPYAQSYEVKEIKINRLVHGDLYQPDQKSDKLAIIVGGSGPTDRDGNQMMLQCDTYKKLASFLASRGIAVFTYDKRILRINELAMSESDLIFDDFVDDLISAVEYFEKHHSFNHTIFLGHSQGSLVSLVALQQMGDAFVSLAGAGETIDSVLVNQISKQAPDLKDQTKAAFKALRKTGKVDHYPNALQSLLRAQIQPFIYSWMQYDPQDLIAAIGKPILLINGDQDIQIDVDQAKKLKAAQPDAQLVIIENMNHILKESKAKDLANQKTYQHPELPLVEDLKTSVLQFIKNQ